ncbi:MAG: dihydroneopterin aldolase [Ignavibacteria bacterium]
MKYTVIKINNAKFYAYHGDLEYEKKYGNQFEVDVKLKCDLSELKDTDKLSNTVDYLAVYNLLSEIFSSEKFNLLETLNRKICKAILDKFEQVEEVEVRVRKPNAPLGIIDSIEVVNKLKRL